MNEIESLVSAAGGVLHKRQLVAHGARDRHLTWAVRRGYVRRPRRGWYTTFAPSDPRYIAIRAGGRLTGASALAYLGAWQWSSRPPITVSVPGNASRLRRMKGVHVVYDLPEVAERGSNWAVAPRDAVREALLEVPFEEAVALLDWALHTRLLERDEITGLARGLPRDIATIQDWVDDRSESFLESIARTRLRRAGHDVASQALLPNNQRIDLVVDGVVALETDGREYHAGSFEQDRRKDVEIAIDGRSPIRVSYTMVRDEWARVVAAIDASAANHRRGPTTRVDNSGSWPRTPRRGSRPWCLRPPVRRLQPELPTGRRTAAGTAARRATTTEAGGETTPQSAPTTRRTGTSHPHPARGRHRRLGTIFG